MFSHARCAEEICLVCPAAFRPDQIRAAFVRCFASLLYTYRRYLGPPNAQQKKSGLLYSFNMDSFLRSVPTEQIPYMTMLQQTQGFNEFIHERESTRGDDPAIRLFDEIIVSKKNRGKASFFSRLSKLIRLPKRAVKHSSSAFCWVSGSRQAPRLHHTKDEC
jgi:hypothetical protein